MYLVDQNQVFIYVFFLYIFYIIIYCILKYFLKKGKRKEKNKESKIFVVVDIVLQHGSISRQHAIIGFYF